jgi:hypothetical protein
MKDQVAGQGRRALSEQMAQTNKGFASRGMMYSGARQKALGQESANMSGQVAQQNQMIHTGLQDEWEGMRQSAIKAGVDQQQLLQAQADFTYETALANLRSKNSAIGQLASLGGAVIGGMYGGPGGAAAGGYAGGQAAGYLTGNNNSNSS